MEYQAKNNAINCLRMANRCLSVKEWFLQLKVKGLGSQSHLVAGCGQSRLLRQFLPEGFSKATIWPP